MTTEPALDRTHVRALERVTDALRTVDTTLPDATCDAVLARLSEEPMPALFAAPLDPLPPRRRPMRWQGVAAGAAAALVLAAAAVLVLPTLRRSRQDPQRTTPVRGLGPPAVGLGPPPVDRATGPTSPAHEVGPRPLVSPIQLERTSGDRNIMPGDEDREAILRAGSPAVTASVRYCIDREGRVDDVEVVKSSGYPAYDERLIRGVSTWTFRPFLAGGVATSVCSSVAFRYQQR